MADLGEAVAEHLRRAREGAARAEAWLGPDASHVAAGISRLPAKPTADGNTRQRTAIGPSGLQDLHSQLADMGASIDALTRPHGFSMQSHSSTKRGPGHVKVLEKLGLAQVLEQANQISLSQADASAFARSQGLNSFTRRSSASSEKDARSVEGEGLLNRLLVGIENQELSIGDAVGTLEFQSARQVKIANPLNQRPQGDSKNSRRTSAGERKEQVESHLQDESSTCSQCKVLCLQVKALAQSLSGLSARIFNWSSALNHSWRDDLVNLVLEYMQPCSHIDEELCRICSELQCSVRSTGHIGGSLHPEQIYVPSKTVASTSALNSQHRSNTIVRDQNIALREAKTTAAFLDQHVNQHYFDELDNSKDDACGGIRSGNRAQLRSTGVIGDESMAPNGSQALGVNLQKDEDGRAWYEKILVVNPPMSKKRPTPSFGANPMCGIASTRTARHHSMPPRRVQFEAPG